MDYASIDLNIRERLNGIINTVLLETILTSLNNEERVEFYDIVRTNKGALHVFIFAKIPNFIDKLEDNITNLQQRPAL